jgi:vanillate O-demethylase monooxygenase subunit
MDYLRNAWYAAIWSEALPPDTLVARTIMEEPLVFFRKEDGGVAVLFDICPHRFAPLHRGKILPGDRVKCPYHGLQFDTTGACVHNPHGSGRIPPACKVQTHAAVEKHSMVWVWMGTQEPDLALIPDYAFLDPESGFHVSRRDYLEMDASYRLVANNLLDLSHAPFLHDGILGFEDSVKADIDVKQEGRYVYVSRLKKNVRPAALPDLLYKGDGQPVDVQSTIRWSAPCHLLNDNMTYPPGGKPEDGAGLLGAHILTPVTPTRTLYHFAAARQGKAPAAPGADSEEIKKQLSELRRIAFEEQDEPIIEGQQAFILEYPAATAKPVLLEIDAGPVRCNRILDEMIELERAGAAVSAA